MKRSPELRDLSEEHHYGLVAARTLRLAAAGVGSLPEAVAAFREQWEREIEPHFRSEEEVLLPEFTGEEGSEPLIARTHREHAALRDYAGKLAAAAAGEPLRLLAAETAQLLHDHIRFEERVLFPAIEAALAGDRLKELGRRLEEHERVSHTCPTPNAQRPTPT